jgi:multisubunit Na+/H+ antiporter MnhB subunit
MWPANICRVRQIAAPQSVGDHWLLHSATRDDRGFDMKKIVLAVTLLMTAGSSLALASVPTVNAPDGGTTVGLLTAAMLGLGVLRMKFGK